MYRGEDASKESPMSCLSRFPFPMGCCHLHLGAATRKDVAAQFRSAASKRESETEIRGQNRRPTLERPSLSLSSCLGPSVPLSAVVKLDLACGGDPIRAARRGGAKHSVSGLALQARPCCWAACQWCPGSGCGLGWLFLCPCCMPACPHGPSPQSARNQPKE